MPYFSVLFYVCKSLTNDHVALNIKFYSGKDFRGTKNGKNRKLQGIWSKLRIENDFFRQSLTK